ncbi:TIGR02646 family protein [Pseudorhodoferax sp. LjRoot39]|uniref:retron system putative HNH endonuclease n=1 Tax=Pseudorhodoferax sp. LjRoot39 TaxID=3342328 RepID=UPI003ECFA8F1
MVELQHSQPDPVLLTQFRLQNPAATTAEWSSQDFAPAKRAIRSALHIDQGGLCAYCEKPLSDDEGQIDHIKPKSGPQAHPQLCFSYRNHAHGCIHPKTCGQKKKDGLLPIEPGPGCNALWTLSTDGTVEPIAGLTRSQRHAVTQTRGMLGLNADANLVDERKRWFSSALMVLRHTPDDLAIFLQTAPYRHILATVF